MSRVRVLVDPPSGANFTVFLSRVPVVGELIQSTRFRLRVTSVTQFAYNDAGPPTEHEPDAGVTVENAG